MRRRTFLSSVSAVGVGGLAGCSAPTGGGETEATGGGGATETTPEGGATGGGESTTEQTGEGGGTQSVRMVTQDGSYFFDPIGLFVESGETVRFVNESGAHSSTAYAEGTGGASVTWIPDGAEAWNSETLTEEGATFDHTFETDGTYDYFCIPHKALGMVGRVVVGDPGGPAEGSVPPDGDVPESEAIVEQGPFPTTSSRAGSHSSSACSRAAEKESNRS